MEAQGNEAMELAETNPIKMEVADDSAESPPNDQAKGVKVEEGREESGPAQASEEPKGPPRAPLTPFFMYVAENRERLVAKGRRRRSAPNVVASKEWRNMSLKDKARWTQRYQEKKHRYLQLLNSHLRQDDVSEDSDDKHTPNIPDLLCPARDQPQPTDVEAEAAEEAMDESMEDPKSQWTEEEAAKPKAPVTPFLMYLKANKARLTKLAKGGKQGALNLTRIAGEEWRGLSRAAKDEWSREFRLQKDDYLRALGLPLPNEAKEAKDKGSDVVYGPEPLKAPVTPFFMFIEENRERLMARVRKGDCGALGLSRLAAEEWRQLDTEEKKRFSARYQEAKARYARITGQPARALPKRPPRPPKNPQPDTFFAHEEQAETPPDDPVQSPAEGRDGKEKKPVTAFLLYFHSERERLSRATAGQGGGATALTRVAGAEWRAMAPEDKAVWVGRAEEQKRAYRQLHGLPEQPAARAYDRPSRPLREEKEGPGGIAYPKRPVTPFFLYMKAHRERLRGLVEGAGEAGEGGWQSAISVTKVAAEEWRTLSDQAKETFTEQFHLERIRYFHDLQRYQQLCAENQVLDDDWWPQ